MKTVEIFTDGACSGNPGPGGWGAILRYGDKVKELSGGEAATTNNRMELTAAIEALGALREPCTVDLYTDSNYVRDGIKGWIEGWKRNGWRTADKKPVKNVELWQTLDEARRRHKVTWHWVKGHAGHPENERADELARLAMAPFKPKRAAKEPVLAPGAPESRTAAPKPKRRRKPAKSNDRGDETATLPDGRKARRSNQSY